MYVKFYKTRKYPMIRDYIGNICVWREQKTQNSLSRREREAVSNIMDGIE